MSSTEPSKKSSEVTSEKSSEVTSEKSSKITSEKSSKKSSEITSDISSAESTKITNEKTQKKTINIFSWNIDWNSADYLQGQQNEIISHYIKKADILAFQEYPNLKKSNNKKIWDEEFCANDNFKCYLHQSSSEWMGLLVRKTLDPPQKMTFYGEFQEGRPFIMILFKYLEQKILFINVHPENKTFKPVQDTMNASDLKKLRDIAIKFDFDRLIMSGDFNRDLNYVELTNSKGKNIKANNAIKVSDRKLTCCSYTNILSIVTDHVLDSNIQINHENNYATVLLKYDNKDILSSDHRPIYAELPI